MWSECGTIIFAWMAVTLLARTAIQQDAGLLELEMTEAVTGSLEQAET